MPAFEIIDNHRLIFNGLEHIEFELSRSSTSYFRVAREAHQVLYRSLIDALRGSANLAVTGKPKGRREHRYRIGNDPIKEIHKTSINGCLKAWRFSDPVVVASFFESDENQVSSEPDGDSKDFLIPFYDALAMVQADCFMSRYIHSQKVAISDTEMKLLEWLHEAIRNEYEHFVPKGYASPIRDLLSASLVSITKAASCLFESNNVIFVDESIEESAIQTKLSTVLLLLDSHLLKAAGDSTNEKA